MNDFYNECLKKGQRFERFVAKKLGLHIYTSKEDQYKYGDSKEHIEIKLDSKVSKTDNILIEVAEKTDSRNKEFVLSGIFRKDKCNKYLVGNRKEAYLFYKKDLINILKIKKYKIFTTPTSKYFLLPIKDAIKIAIKVYDWSTK